MFLSADRIKDLVSKGDIQVFYKMVKTSDKEIKNLSQSTSVDFSEKAPGQTQTDVNNFFDNSLGPTGLTLHAGPYMRVEKKPEEVDDMDFSRVQRPHPFDYVKLLDIDNYYDAAPGELLLIATNESILLKNNIGAVVVSKVRATSKGWSHISTPIDPGWEGVLQISQVNLSPFYKRVEPLARLCTVLFYEIDPPPSPAYIDRVRSSKTHYGIKWEDYERTKQDIFPMDDFQYYLEDLYRQRLSSFKSGYERKLNHEKTEQNVKVWNWVLSIVLAIVIGIFFPALLHFRDRITDLEYKIEMSNEMGKQVGGKADDPKR